MGRKWTDDDEHYLFEQRGLGRPWDYLAVELKRSIISCQSKYARLTYLSDRAVVKVIDHLISTGQMTIKE